MAMTGCVSRENLAFLPGSRNLDFQITATRFKAAHPFEGRLLVRPVKDSRAEFVGQNIGGKKAKISDSALSLDLASEFQTALLRELKGAQFSQEVVLSDEKAAPGDYVLETDLQVLFGEVKGFIIAFAGSVLQYKAVLSKGDKVLMDETILSTGNESERNAVGGAVGTIVEAGQDVAAVAVQKGLVDLFKKMEAVS
jgi:hypothetical protein